MAAQPVGRLTFGDAFSDAFGTYGRRFGHIVLAAALLAIPAALISAAIQATLTPDALRAGGTGEELEALGGDDWRNWVFAILLTTLATLPFSAVLIAAVYRVRAGGGALDGIRFALSRGAAVVATALLTWGALVTLSVAGTLAAVLVGDAVGGTAAAVIFGILAALALAVLTIWLGTRWVAAVPAAAVERLAPGAALRRSAALVRGRWWAVFGILIVASLIVGAASGFVGGFLGAIAAISDSAALRFVVDFVVATLTQTFATPLFALFVAVIYDRLRAENDD